MSTDTRIITHKIDVGGLRLHVEERGLGPAIVFGHNLLGASWIFEHQVADLSRDHRVITFDLRDHGQSDPSPTAWSLMDVAEDYRKVMDALKVRRGIVVGQGLGAKAALHLLINAPDRIEGLVLINPSANNAAPHMELKARLFGQAYKLIGGRDFMIDLLEEQVFAEYTRKRRNHRPYVQRWRDGVKAMSSEAVARGIRASTYRPDIELRLAGYDHHALVISSNRNVVITKDHPARIVDQMPNARRQIVHEASDYTSLEQAEETTKQMRKFVRRLHEGGIRDERTGMLKKF